MAGRSAAVDPRDLRIFEQIEIRLLQQHPGREAGVILVERGLERKTPGRAKEIDQHRQRAVFEIERAHVEPSRIGRSEEHTSELQSLMRISYAVFCLKKKNTTKQNRQKHNRRIEKRTMIDNK